MFCKIVLIPTVLSLFMVSTVMAATTPNYASANIYDNAPPVVTCPANIVKSNDVNLCGAIVNYTVTATDDFPGVSVVVYPPSGSFFPIGVSTVIAIATDAAGLKDTCYFVVTVNDTWKPTVTCSSNIVVTVNPGETGKIVNFSPTVTDNCPGVGFVATPPSGSLFPLGITSVKAVATDAHGLKDSCTFTVEVKIGLNPDFVIDANPDTIFATAGIPDSLLYFINLSSFDGYNKSVNLSVSALLAGVVLNFGASPIIVPNSTTLGGHTSVGTPAGAYELTITAMEAATKAGPHSTTVWLIVKVGLNVNSVRVVCPVTKPVVDGDSIAIQIRITNDVNLGALSLGFHYNSNDVEITSISFDSSIAPERPGGEYHAWSLFPEENQVLIGWVDFSGAYPLVPQSDGLLATLWMQVPLGTPSQNVNIDLAFVPPAGESMFAPTVGGHIHPGYTDCGNVDIVIGNPNVCGDANCDSIVDISDAVYLISYIFSGGPAPCAGCK